MSSDKIINRAELTGKLISVLDSRTLPASSRLAQRVAEGMSILDIGCGTGGITRGIAEAAGPRGRVVGIDSNAKLIERAREVHEGVPGLTFETGDIYKLSYKGEFDMVTATRLFVWLSDPQKGIAQLRAAIKPGGRLLLIDYNHEKIAWNPAPPPTMLTFYSSYLKWRSDLSMNNAIADLLPAWLQEGGLQQVAVTPQHEVINRGDPDFQERFSLWADTASSRGPQMAKEGYISVEQYNRAEKDYREWMEHGAQSLTMYMLAVEGVNSELA